MRKIGLRVRVVASTGLIISTLFGVTAWRNVAMTRDLLVDGVMARAEALGSRLRTPVEEFLRAGSPLSMLASMGLGAEARDMVAKSDGSLASAAVVDRDGATQLHSDQGLVGQAADRAVAAAIPHLDGKPVLVEGAAGGDLVVLVPALGPDGRPAAAVSLQFSRRTLDEALRRAMLELGALLLFSLVVTFAALTTLVTRTVVLPLRTLGQAARAVASGRLGERVPIARQDEIGELALRFNEMADQLGAVIEPARSAAGAVSTASRAVAKSQGSVRGGAESQQESLTRTAAAVGTLERAASTIQGRVESLSTSAQSASATSLELGATAEEVTAHVDELARSVEATSSGITEIAASLKQVAGTVDDLSRATDTAAASLAQMDASIVEIERIAKETAALSTSAADDSENGRSAVEATVNGMEEIRASSQEAAAVLRGFEVTVTEIGRILQIIDEVADQTNLLALNAAIIAAQAGERGRGFAVVAEEIKALAERTGVSTREIAGLIGKVQAGSRAAVAAMEQGETTVAEGVARSRRAGDALGKIREGTKRTQDMVAQIARATQEHASGSRQVTQSVARISEMTRQLRAAADEQSRGGAEVARAATAMTEASRLVRRSAHEQRDASKSIGATMEQVADSIKQIAEATQQQTRETSEIVAAMEAIRGAAETTTETTVEMDAVVETLRREASRLESSLARFEGSAGGPQA